MTTFAKRCGAALLLLALVGCGDGKPTRVAVSGKVTIDGAPVTRGYVQFVPTKGRPSGGQIQPDGTFKLACYDERNPDGCMLGEHTVTVTANEPAGNDVKWLAPQKYRDTSSSGLKENITGPRNDLEIKLTWEGEGKPFVEKMPNEGKAY